MKVLLPESIDDITLEQYQKYQELLKREDLEQYPFNKRKLAIFTGIKMNIANQISIKDINEMIAQIDLALEQTVVFKQRFFIDKVEFGFIPNLDKMCGAEYFDLGKYSTEIEDLHKTMSILFRPITEADGFGNYKIKDYNGTEELCDVMKLMPLSIVNGALVFFSSLANELLNYIQRYTKEEQAKEAQHQITFANGDGTQPLMN